MNRLWQWIQGNALPLIVVAVLAIVYLNLRSQPTELLSADDLAQKIAGRTTVLYFYSNS